MTEKDAIVEAFRATSEISLENDRALLKVIEVLVEKYTELEKKVDMLMELHRIGDDDH